MSDLLKLRFRSIFTLLLLIVCLSPLAAQDYFGRNKVRYRSFDFKVMKTDHFDIYYYDEEKEAVAEAARLAERWHVRLSQALQHQLSGRQPLILYGSHPEFEQTTAIAGEIGEGTGGVTEALKRRVVLPFSGPLRETDHVLGHEIIHAFQYDMTGQGESGVGFEAPGALRLPLWFIEGMAEYLSLGPIDSLTAMWIRDAVRREALPDIKDLDNPELFPYRWGQAFWAYIGGRFGDEVIGQILRSAGRTGDPFNAIEKATGVEIKQLSSDWKAATQQAYEPILEATAPATEYGRALITAKKRGGSINVSPAISPDGKYVIFFSEKELFSIDIFLADVESGRIIRKITQTAMDPHFESLQFINSAGAWSPDSKRVAIGAISKGRPVLTLIDVEDADTVKELRFPQLGEIFNPAWSPDGRQIAFSAITGGLMDLYLVDVESEQLRRLTNNAFAEIQPEWSPDGRRLVFATDRFTSNLESLSFGHMSLALMEVSSGDITPLPVLEGGRQMNPQWGPNDTIFFVSDHEGISNVYALRPNSANQIQKVTNLQTGASGITRLSPALTVARQTGRMIFSAFEGGDYNLFELADGRAGHRVSNQAVPGNPALLPPEQRTKQAVAAFLSQPSTGLPPSSANFQVSKYNPGLSLDYISQPSVGVGVSSFGTFVGGGTALHFSDMLGEHNLTTIFEAANSTGGNPLNGISALVGYENQKHRWDWGVIGGQVPFLTGDLLTGSTTVDGQEVLVQQQALFWEINREIQGYWAYPFNRAQRLEFGGGFRNISFASEVQTDFFSPITGEFLGSQSEDIPTPDAINLGTASAALVYDQSVFGGTSPVIGQRYRFELEQVAGNLLFTNALLDYRRYFMFARPFTLAGRFLHYGRYGRDSEDSRLQGLFIGYPSLIRGYDVNSFSVGECGNQPDGSCPVFDKLIGSRLAVANLELRVPLLGPLGLVPSRGFIPIELAPFVDAGVAWTANDEWSILGGDRKPVTSYGSSLRINLLGFAVAQISLVHPNDRPTKNWLWEFSLVPGF